MNNENPQINRFRAAFDHIFDMIRKNIVWNQLFHLNPKKWRKFCIHNEQQHGKITQISHGSTYILC